MEVGQHRGHHAEAVTREDEQGGLAGARAALEHPGRLQHPHRRGPHGDDAPPLSQLGKDGVAGLRRNREPFGRQYVFPRILHAHRCERAVPHMQHEVRHRYPALLQPPEHGQIEVKSGGRSGDRTGGTGVHRLIPLPVAPARCLRPRWIPADVGRQRSTAHLAGELEQVLRPRKDPDPALPAPKVLTDLETHGFPFAGNEPHARAESRPGQGAKDQGAKRIARSCLLRKDQHFDAPAANLFPGRNARGNHPRDVPDQEVTRPQQRRKVRKSPVRRPATGAQMQQAGVASRGGRFLGDQFRGQVECEVGGPHFRETRVSPAAGIDHGLGTGEPGKSVPDAARPRCRAPRSVIMRPFPVRLRKPR